MAGIDQLGYLVFEVRDLEAWERFGRDVLGMLVVDRREDGGFGLRMDRHRSRFHVVPGEADDLAAVGWEVADGAALDALVTSLAGRGVATEEAGPAEAASRGVARLVRLRDPAGNALELVTGPERAAEPFDSELVPGGFVADDFGLGHVVLATRDKAESMAFYQDALGFRLSDHIVTRYFGHDIDLSFFHINGRHHSLALGGPLRKRLHHFMVEVKQVDLVGLAFDRTMKAGLQVFQTLGRHPNDHMLSFYAFTPSGFQFEYGWGGRVIDDAHWTPRTYDRISEWGHHPPQVLLPRPPKGA